MRTGVMNPVRLYNGTTPGLEPILKGVFRPYPTYKTVIAMLPLSGHWIRTGKQDSLQSYLQCRRQFS